MIRAVSHSPHLGLDKENAHGLLESESVYKQYPTSDYKQRITWYLDPNFGHNRPSAVMSHVTNIEVA